MKTSHLLLALAFTAVRLAAETLKSDAAVFSQTDPKSPVLARLKAGAVITPVGEAPAGWRRVEVSGPFDAFVNNRDITKALEVREGASIYAAPRKDAPLLATAAAGDKTEVTGLVGGDWCQIRLDKKLQGFIAVGETANLPADPPPAAPAVPAPAAPAPSPVGRPVPLAGNTADMPRMFAGRLVLAKRPILNPNPPYDYQLTDASGRRFAYVDTRRLLLTDKIEAYLDRSIAVTGTVRNTVDGKDLVIAAESMQLR
ncbi:MAG: SH3 domain-containing protein [Opitutaceae bacterium]|nr:SH3 domain-containing protein [Opitutaceae bacterium]